jgi:hypothetical protein
MSDSNAFGEGIQRREVIDDAQDLEQVRLPISGLTEDGRVVLDHVTAADGHGHAERRAPPRCTH